MDLLSRSGRKVQFITQWHTQKFIVCKLNNKFYNASNNVSSKLIRKSETICPSKLVKSCELFYTSQTVRLLLYVPIFVSLCKSHFTKFTKITKL